MAIHRHGYTENWDYLPGGTDATAGDVVLLGAEDDLVGVVVTDIAANYRGAVSVSGVFEFDTEDTMAQGDAAYVDSEGDITDDSTDTYAGRVARATASGKVLVSLNIGTKPSAS